MNNKLADQKRPRSPGYPAIDLKAALNRAQLLYRAEGRNKAPVQTILSHWGYKPGSGAGMVALAALKKFGLLIDEGSGTTRKARLSEEALRILRDERDHSPERDQYIMKAALKPAIYNLLWTKYSGELPSDATLKHELIFEHQFTDIGAAEFIGPFRSTIAFARVGEGIQVPREGPDGAESGDLDSQSDDSTDPTDISRQVLPQGRSQVGVRQEIQIPLAPGEYATIRAPFPLSEVKWKQMLMVLEVMKPALVSEPAAEP